MLQADGMPHQISNFSQRDNPWFTTEPMHSGSLEFLFARACHSIEANRWDEAESILSGLLKENPKHGESLYLMSKIAVQKDNFDAAIRWLELALELRPDWFEAWQDLGFACLRNRLVSKAAVAFAEVVRLRPDLASGRHNLGNTLFELSLFREAESNFLEALKLNPDLTPSRANLVLLRKIESEVAALADEITSPRDPEEQTDSSRRLTLRYRELLPHLLNRLGLTGAAVEIGVAGGVYSESILRTWEGTILYSVDPWRQFSTSEADVSQEIQDQRYIDTIRKLLPFEHRSVIWRLTSEEASGLVEDHSLSFCYIDADHTFEAVKRDIACWFPKIKPGGIIAGHDYIPDGDYPFGQFGVQKAVNAFVASEGARLFVTSQDSPPSWFVIKM